MLKLASIAAIAIGECLAVFTEIHSAKNSSLLSVPMSSVMGRAFLLLIPATCLIVLGYAYGIRAFGNIWVVSVISLTSILVIEPILDYAIFGQMPTRGAGIGLVFGALGFAFALFF